MVFTNQLMEHIYGLAAMNAVSYWCGCGATLENTVLNLSCWMFTGI